MRCQRLADNINELCQAGLKKQTGSYLLATYTSAASQHALRMSFVCQHEAPQFDTQVVSAWNTLLERNCDSQFFFSPLKKGGFDITSAVNRKSIAPWTSWKSALPGVVDRMVLPEIETLLHKCPRLARQLTTLQGTLARHTGKHGFDVKTLSAAFGKDTNQKHPHATTPQ